MSSRIASKTILKRYGARFFQRVDLLGKLACDSRICRSRTNARIIDVHLGRPRAPPNARQHGNALLRERERGLRRPPRAGFAITVCIKWASRNDVEVLAAAVLWFWGRAANLFSGFSGGVCSSR
jgi:hypothetical protein